MDDMSEQEPTATSDGADGVADAPDAPEPPREGVSRTVLVVSVIAALLIAGVAGMAIGWKIEQQRVKDDLSAIRPIGAVTKVTDDSVTVKLSTANGTRTYVLTNDTKITGATELTEGSTVLIRKARSSDGKVEARQIVVLPGPDGAPAKTDDTTTTTADDTTTTTG
jgi:hypothetical protein